MPSTFQALAVALLALLPGALYELAREQRAGRWGLRGADQIFRLLSFSVAFQVLIAPVTYWLYSEYIVTHRLTSGRPVDWGVWALGGAYLVVPFVLGRFTAWASKNRDLVDRQPTASKLRRRVTRSSAFVVRLYTDVAPAPRAWDYLWSRPELTGWVVLYLKDGPILAGEWNGSYAAGYPEPGDLYLADQIDVDDTGTILTAPNRDGVEWPISLGKGLLVRWDEIRYLDFYDATMDPGGSESTNTTGTSD